MIYTIEADGTELLLHSDDIRRLRQACREAGHARYEEAQDCRAASPEEARKHMREKEQLNGLAASWTRSRQR